MIDTIRFRIPLEEYQIKLIKEKSVETSRIDNNSGILKYRVFNVNINLGSFDRNINIFLSESSNQFCILEFSVPKFYYGQNVYLFYLDKLGEVLTNLQEDLKRYFQSFPTINKWELMRLDICYSWKFLSQDLAERILEIIRSYKFSRKKIMNYDSAIMQKGSTYSVKWYLKKPEFYYHDFPLLLRLYKENYAYNVANVSEGVLRFEVTMRHAHLQRLFGKSKIYYNDINDDVCLALLQKYFIKFFAGKIPKFMTSQTVLNKLLHYYSKKKTTALRLYEYYLTFHSMTATEQKNYLMFKNKKTIWRLNQQLKKAGVGLPSSKINDVEMDFSIPSQYAVNSANVGLSDVAEMIF